MCCLCFTNIRSYFKCKITPGIPLFSYVEDSLHNGLVNSHSFIPISASFQPIILIVQAKIFKFLQMIHFCSSYIKIKGKSHITLTHDCKCYYICFTVSLYIHLTVSNCTIIFLLVFILLSIYSLLI